MRHQLDLDMRMLADEGADMRHQPEIRQRRPDRHLDHAACALARRAGGSFRFQRGLGHRFGALMKAPATGRQHQPFVGAHEQLGAKLLLQRRDLAADGRVAGAQLPGRAEIASGVDHGIEGATEIPVHVIKSGRLIVQIRTTRAGGQPL